MSLETDLNKPNIEFTADGDLKNAELKIMNLRPSGNNKNLVWEEVRRRRPESKSTSNTKFRFCLFD